MKNLTKLLKNFKIYPQRIEALQGDGSDRKFFRLFLKNSSLILILPQENELGLKEAEVYYELGKFFYKNNIPVPEIKFWEPKSGILIVEDLGDLKLCDIEHPFLYYYKGIELLVKIQGLVHSFPIDKTLDTPFYDFNFLWNKEVNYFLYWYIKIYKNLELTSSFIDEIFNWAKEKCHFISQVVIHRDFQSKNLMIKDKRLYAIDFQGAKLGPPSYDLVSLLFDPYVNHFENLNTLYTFLDYYLSLTKYSSNLFFEEFKFLGIIRLMQALGAYCKLSKAQKTWFTPYISIGEKRLFNLMKTFYPEIYKLFYSLKILN